ncbi:OmpA family protein [Tamlana agarivorans]|uniref:OmpA family protein n=1 Tax=Pseudotamlana agarivorans TaxID=481183 RepID=A0ACC5U740_9FLAO|nr:DUF5723 family protein [Tamlana agarivorans]MBU2950117.1 OmpA family protein [Tamlana agarivorans]
MRKITLLLLVMASSLVMQGQSFNGFLTDNYSGVNSVIANPANITDSRFKTDINLVGVSAFIGNDYAGVNVFDAIKDDYDFDASANIYPTDNNNALVNTDIMGPSFMFNINRKSSLAVFTRSRAFVTAHNVNGNLIENFDSDDGDDVNFDDGSLITTGHGWGELGVTYARVIIDDRTMFLKAGLTAKYLQGAGSAHINGDNISVDYLVDGAGPDLGTIETTGRLTYAVFDSTVDEDGYEYELPNATGVGFDIGFVYEWRPNYPDYQKTNSNGDTYYVKDKNKYKLKLGLSITDIGSINYKDGVEETYIIDKFDTVENLEDEFDNADSFEDFLRNYYVLDESKKGYKVNLPTALHFNADWSFTNRLYVNLNTDLSLVSKDNVGATRIANTVSLTPRFESKLFSFYLPMGVVQYSGFQAGAGLRFGPLYVGSGSVLSALVSDNTKAADVYAGIKIPVYQGDAKDRDGDGVIDKLDACPKVAGPEENSGCPWGDADADGVLDNEDACPNEAGPKENKGCPWGDSDADGVLDNVDACPNMAGTLENKGCPWGDADNDGVLDNVDQCPKVAGTIEYDGCPSPAPKVTEAVLKTLNAYAKTILFNNGKATLKDSSKAVLDNIVGVLKDYPNSHFSINGHTDSSGSDTLNQKLSENRASAVMTYLIENGISSSRLSHKGFGESNPIDDNTTKEGRRNNRRVEVVLVR